MQTYYSTKEVAERLHCSVRHVQNLIADGDLEAANIGRTQVKLRVSAKALEEYIQRRTLRSA